jgi:hypothetical protein
MRIMVQCHPGQQFMRPYLKKLFTTGKKYIGLVAWLKVKAQSSSPSTTTTTKENMVFLHHEILLSLKEE